MNDDQLNLEVSAYGRNLLVNSGRWRYTTSPGIDWLDKAEYFKSTAAYNSVLCDGMNQVHGDADGEMRIAADSDYACGTFCAGYGYNGGAQVSREVGKHHADGLRGARMPGISAKFFMPRRLAS